MIVAEVVGAERVVAFLEALPERTRKVLKEEVNRLGLALLRKVKEEKLTGQALKVRTGTLRRGINLKVTETDAAFVASVGTNVAYARIHELGFDGTQNVQAHLRTIKQAWGMQLKSPVEVKVRAFTRHMKMPKRSFLATALSEMAPEISERLQAAVRGATKP